MLGVEEEGWMDHPPHPIFFFSSQLGPSEEDAIAASPFPPIPPPKEEGRFGAERKTEEGGRERLDLSSLPSHSPSFDGEKMRRGKEIWRRRKRERRRAKAESGQCHHL